MPAINAKKAKKAAPMPVNKGKGKAPPPKPVEEEESSEEESSEEEVVAVPAKKKATPAKKPAKKEESEDEESSEEEDSDEEEEAAAKPAAKNAAPMEESSDEEESDDDEEEDQKVPKVAAGDDDESDDEEESGDDDDAESDSDEESDSDSKKRKKKDAGKPAKKAKIEEEATSTLFIAGLDKEMEESKIVKMFKKKGINISAIRRPEKKSIVYADLADPSQMDAALALDGTEIKGNTVKIERAKVQKEKATESPKKKEKKPNGDGDAFTPSKPVHEDKSATSLFVKNLDWGVTEEMLMEMFEGCNEVYLPEQDGRKKGFGYVRYAEGQSELSEKHMAELQGSELNGRAIFIDKAQPRDRATPTRGGRGGRGGTPRGGGGDRGGGGNFPEGPTKTLIIKSLSYDTNWQSLKDAFEGCSHSRVCTDRETGKSRGFGFVEFDSVDAAKSAMNSMNNQEVDGRTISINYALERSDMPPRDGGGRGGGGGRGAPRGRGGRGGGFGGRGRGGSRGGGFSAGSGKKTRFDDSD